MIDFVVLESGLIQLPDGQVLRPISGGDGAAGSGSAGGDDAGIADSMGDVGGAAGSPGPTSPAGDGMGDIGAAVGDPTSTAPTTGGDPAVDDNMNPAELGKIKVSDFGFPGFRAAGQIGRVLGPALAALGFPMSFVPGMALAAHGNQSMAATQAAVSAPGVASVAAGGPGGDPTAGDHEENARFLNAQLRGEGAPVAGPAASAGASRAVGSLLSPLFSDRPQPRVESSSGLRRGGFGVV